MVPLGAGSPDCATQALAVGEGVPVTKATVGVATGVGVDLDFVGDPQAATSRATPAVAAIRRNPVDRSADSELRLLVVVRRCDDVEMFAGPGINGIDHALQVDTRRRQLVRRARRHLRVDGAPEESEFLETIEANLEGCRVATADSAAELVEAEWPVEQGSDDVHRPLLLQDLYGFVDWAICAISIHLVVPPSRSRS
jgi:hypothetical protein